MKIRVFLKYFVDGCLWKQLLPLNELQDPSNFIFIMNLITIMPLRQFYPKIRATKLQKSAKFYLTLYL